MYDTRLNLGNETFSWQYDDLNRVTRETYPDGNYLEYGYNNLGARTSMRLPSGHTQTYNYDARARLSSILHSLGNRTFSYSYNTSDETLQMITYPNSIQNVFSYNSLYRPSNITATPLGTGVIHYSVDYTYDDVGNKTRAEWYSDVSPVLNYVKNYQYDNLHQLTHEAKWNPGETVKDYEYSYTFDDAGNRTSMSYYENGQGTVTTTYLNNNINQLTDRFITGGDEFNYSYDLNGNMTQEYNLGNSRTFTWNQDNRLIEVDDDINGGHVQYVYDAVGRRLIRKDLDSGVWTKYYYDGLTVVAEMQSTDGGQNWSWKRIMATGPGVIGNIFSISTYNSTSWISEYLHYDAIGNVVMKTDYTGNPVAAFDQEAYGIVKDGAQSGYHLTTKEYDTGSDLYYFWQRWYDPVVGRFISKAPYPSHKEHPFIYGNNNPVKNFDVRGERVELCNTNSWSPHWWLRVNGEGHGFYPTQTVYGFIGQPGGVFDDSNLSGSCHEYICSQGEDCVTDLWNWYSGRYILYIYDCWGWANEILTICGCTRKHKSCKVYPLGANPPDRPHVPWQ